MVEALDNFSFCSMALKLREMYLLTYLISKAPSEQAKNVIHSVEVPNIKISDLFTA